MPLGVQAPTPRIVFKGGLGGPLPFGALGDARADRQYACTDDVVPGPRAMTEEVGDPPLVNRRLSHTAQAIGRSSTTDPFGRLPAEVRAVPPGQRGFPMPGAIHKNPALKPLVPARASAQTRHVLHGGQVCVKSLVFLIRTAISAIIVQVRLQAKFASPPTVGGHPKKARPSMVFNRNANAALMADVKNPEHCKK